MLDLEKMPMSLTLFSAVCPACSGCAQVRRYSSSEPTMAIRSLDERVREEEDQRDDQAVDCQGLHEGQREEEDAAEIISHLGLPANAIDATARGNALPHARADRSEADGEASAHGRECGDPDASLGCVGRCGRHEAIPCPT